MTLAAKKNTASISILAQSDERTLCVSFSGLISREQYENNFLVPFEVIRQNHPHYGLLIHYAKNYKGWDKAAADLSLKDIIEFGAKARKLAYVNPPESKIFQIKIMQPLFGGEIRFFDEDERDDAIAWVKS